MIQDDIDAVLQGFFDGITPTATAYENGRQAKQSKNFSQRFPFLITSTRQSRALG